MASIAFPSLAKKATLSDGTTYGYVAIAPSSSSAVTFLLLHGYPSSSYDWRHQIAGLQKAGCGVIVPDLLGYGDTDKPTELSAYRMKTMCSHMAEIMDLEKVEKAVAVGHDWGVGLLSRLPTYQRHRFYGIITVAVSYVQPGLVWNIDAICELTKSIVGYETYGYWHWHDTEEAVEDCEKHPASAFNLVYATDPEMWITDFAPVGKAAEFVRAGRLTELPSWYSLQDYTIRDRIYAKGGYRGPLSWYKAAIRGINAGDENMVSEEDVPCPLPNLFIAAKKDFVCRADIQTMLAQKWVPNLKIHEVDCGHWVQLEEPELVNKLLIDYAKELTTPVENVATIQAEEQLTTKLQPTNISVQQIPN